jgi:hypothetical protein
LKRIERGAVTRLRFNELTIHWYRHHSRMPIGPQTPWAIRPARRAAFLSFARASGCLCFIKLIQRPPALKRPEKIAIGQMRSSSVTGVLIYCADHRCSHVMTASVEQWPDDVRLSDVEGRYVCSMCGRRGADIRPDWQSKK